MPTIFKINNWTSGGSSSGGLAGFNEISETMAATTGQKFADLLDVDGEATGFALELLAVINSAASSSGYAASSPEPSVFPVWFFRGLHRIGDETATDVYRISGLPAGRAYSFRPSGNENDALDTTYTATGGYSPVTYDRNGGDPVAAPPTMTGTVPGDGIVTISVSSNGAEAIFNGFLFEVADEAGATPTITDINTTNEVTPGEAATLTGTNLTNATGLNIGSEAQADFAVASATSVTFTGTRGGNPYNQDLTATLLSPDGNATITVQQVPATGFVVTAANPNTTDDASLWSDLVDTATGDPVTVVDGDQALVKSGPAGVAVDPDGTITADETGDLIVQFWRQSEGVWGSDQTVSFVVPGEGGGTVTIGASSRPRRIGTRQAVRPAVNPASYQAIYGS